MENKIIENKIVALSKPIKIGCWQITKVRDKFGQIKINIRYAYKQKSGWIQWQYRCQQIYAKPRDWEELKRAIKERRRK